MKHFIAVKEFLEEAGFTVDATPLIWWKGNNFASVQPHFYPSNYETVFHISKGKRALRKQVGKIFGPWGSPSNRIHPTERCSKILRMLIEQSTVPFELVLDPYAGSFSTVMEAVKMQRHGIGCERVRTYWKAATDRLVDAVGPGELLVGEDKGIVEVDDAYKDADIVQMSDSVAQKVEEKAKIERG
jgi:hypothetical protein